MDIERRHPPACFPNRTGLQRVVISWNHKHRTWDTSQSIDDIADQFPADSVVFESVAGQDEKVDRFFPANLGNAPTGLQADRAHPISNRTNLCGSHSHLPIARMYESHTEIMHQ